MKRLLLVTMGAASFLLSPAQVAIDEAHFPDEAFRDFVSKQYDRNNDLMLDEEEINAATKMDIGLMSAHSDIYGFWYIRSMKGVEFFHNLQILEIPLQRGEMIKEVDLSHNTNLVRLDWENREGLEKLDLSPNTKLEYVRLSAPSLSSFSLNAPLLDTLSIAPCKIGQLDLSASPNLTYLSCSDCGLSTLELSHCEKLKVLYCRDNQLAVLNLNEKAVLEEFNGLAQRTVHISPVDGMFDMASFPGFDADKSFDWKNAYKNGSLIVIDRANAGSETASVSYQYKTGTKSGEGQEINVRLECPNQDLPVLLKSLGETSTEWFYDADGDGVKEYYKMDSGNDLKGRYHWRAPGCYAQDFLWDLPFTSLDEDRMMTHLNNDGVPDFADRAFTDFSKIKVALSGADGTYTLMDGSNSAYPLDVNHDGLPDLFAFNTTDWSILYQNPDGTFTATRIDTLSRAQADSLVARKAEEADGKFDTGGLPSLRNLCGMRPPRRPAVVA